jgi:ABC-type uncharacterized transport system substrate-binding protein
MAVRRALTRLIALLTIVFLAAPCATMAQPTASAPRIGFLGTTTAAGSASWLEAFRAGLRDLGYVEGKNVVIEYRWADDKYDRLPVLAEELVRLKVDVLVTHTTPGALAAKRATTTIPIVMVTSSDAVRTGIVASLARPRGNITGSTFMGPELYAKQLELVKAAMPNVKRVARLVNPTNAAVGTVFKEEERAALSLKIEASHVEARNPREFDAAFAVAVTKGVEAVVISSDPMFLANSRAIADIAGKKRLPSIGRAQFAEAGGMIGFGPEPLEPWRRASYFVDRILKGAKPADLPVEQPIKFELVINLKTARAIGLTIPPSLLLRADRVIE